ncbi:MAG: hypothetical protein O6947_08900, partial [Acidobacteria bacterium]|nr:hypothetical protein [Acidobacteriota bacterium]
MLSFQGDRFFRVVSIILWFLVVITPLNLFSPGARGVMDPAFQTWFLIGYALFYSFWFLIYLSIY